MDPMRMWFLGGPIFQESEEKKRGKKTETPYIFLLFIFYFFTMFLFQFCPVILSTYKLFLFDLTKD
jgi:hypothetical protein